MPGLLFAFTGAFLAIFMAPFSWVSGFHSMAIMFLLAGMLWIAGAARSKISPGWLSAALAFNLMLVLFLYGLTSPGAGYYPPGYSNTVDGVKTIDDAVIRCRASGLSGWDLAAYAQNLTARKFIYSQDNPWQTPEDAFESGLGYCQQEALALKDIYDSLGIKSTVVYCSRCRFEARMVDGSLENEAVTGHVWLRVSIDGKTLDVSPGSASNLPGVVDFIILSDVKPLPWMMQPVTHIFSVIESRFEAPGDRA